MASDGRTQLEELMKLHPSQIDYNLLEKIHENTVREEVMDDITEENAGNEDFLFDILDDPLDIFNLIN